jgi:hypothetical protein
MRRGQFEIVWRSARYMRRYCSSLALVLPFCLNIVYVFPFLFLFKHWNRHKNILKRSFNIVVPVTFSAQATLVPSVGQLPPSFSAKSFDGTEISLHCCFH